MRTYGITQTEDMAVVAGRRTYVDLEPGRSNRFLLVTIALTLTITAPVTSILNLGSAAAVFDEMGLDDGGTVTAIGDPRSFEFASEFMRSSQGTRVRLTSTAATAYNLVERIVVPFEYFFAGKPRETQYLNPNSQKKFRFFMTLNGTNSGLAKLVTGGTAAITNVTVKVQQAYDLGEIALPQFAPRWSELVAAVPVANAAQVIELSPGKDWIRGITILQEGIAGGLVTDIITRLQLRWQDDFIIGQNGPVDYQQLASMQEFESGGNVFAANGGSIVHLNFQTHGRLTKIIEPRSDDVLRLVLDARPSVVAGAGSSQIKVLLHKLSRDVNAGVVDPVLQVAA